MRISHSEKVLRENDLCFNGYFWVKYGLVAMYLHLLLLDSLNACFPNYLVVHSLFILLLGSVTSIVIS